MSEDDEYELLPRQEIEALKKEIDRLKKHPLGEMEEGDTLLEAINNLNNSIRKLIDIFTKAQTDLEGQYSEGAPLDDLKDIKDQNEEIAQGILAVADMLKENKEAGFKENREAGLFKTFKEEPSPEISSSPKIPMLRPTGMDIPGGPPDPFANDLPAHIPPPPQFYSASGAQTFASKGASPFEEPMPTDKKKRLFSR
ncbi:MAG TPA: hypothetical protein VJ461_05590 [Candidatus Nanoarchaeia archaeon]|nr:hypothetical protein [Candidatus Nanoarchaeia archaeon]